MPQLDVFVGPKQSLASKFVFSARNVILDPHSSDIAVATGESSSYVMPAFSFDYAMGLTHGTALISIPTTGDVVEIHDPSVGGVPMSNVNATRFYRIVGVKAVKYLVNRTNQPLSLSQYFNVQLPASQIDGADFRALLRAAFISWYSLHQTDPVNNPSFFEFLQAGHSDTILRTWTGMTVAETLLQTAQLNFAGRESWISAFELPNRPDSTVWSRASAALQSATLGQNIMYAILRKIHFHTLVFKLESVSDVLDNVVQVLRDIRQGEASPGDNRDTSEWNGIVYTPAGGGGAEVEGTADFTDHGVYSVGQHLTNLQPPPLDTGTDYRWQSTSLAAMPAVEEADVATSSDAGVDYRSAIEESGVATLSDADVETLSLYHSIILSLYPSNPLPGQESGADPGGGEESLQPIETDSNTSPETIETNTPIVSHIQQLQLDPSQLGRVLLNSDAQYRNALYMRMRPQKVMIVRLDNTVRRVRRIVLVGYQIRGWTEQRGVSLVRQAVVHIRGVDGSVISSDPAVHRAFAVLPLGADASSHFDYENGVASAAVTTPLRALEVTVADRSGDPLHVDGLWFRIDAEC